MVITVSATLLGRVTVIVLSVLPTTNVPVVPSLSAASVSALKVYLPSARDAVNVPPSPAVISVSAPSLLKITLLAFSAFTVILCVVFPSVASHSGTGYPLKPSTLAKPAISKAFSSSVDLPSIVPIKPFVVVTPSKGDHEDDPLFLSLSK